MSVRRDLESPDAMPSPWLSAWGPNRGWPGARVASTRVGPSLGALGQWEDVESWQELSDAGGGDEPSWTPPDPGPIDDWWSEPPSPGPSPGPIDDWWSEPPSPPTTYTQSELDAAAAQILGMAGAGPERSSGVSVRDLLADFGRLLSGAAPVLRELFPAGLPPVWTPCPRGTYWNGTTCAVTPSACPKGTIFTGTTCRPISLADVFGGWGGGGEAGGGAGGWPEMPVTRQRWFWPVVIGGGIVVAYGMTRRR